MCMFVCVSRISLPLGFLCRGGGQRFILPSTCHTSCYCLFFQSLRWWRTFPLSGTYMYMYIYSSSHNVNVYSIDYLHDCVNSAWFYHYCIIIVEFLTCLLWSTMLYYDYMLYFIFYAMPAVAYNSENNIIFNITKSVMKIHCYSW